ncbi:AAA family ATPase [Bacillus altitudinis]|uniref:AAA family ATPase n=1 Tax=Bacillus altitudinis TaxID=293387 RepID=UPI001F4EF341|nr:AAA family ATPase [Bacillus altitudinis]MDC7797570.1 AAA family ATPase [Bacillus altitudinis]UNG01762.1 AAA family ATPase [Bacillus altitudinis]
MKIQRLKLENFRLYYGEQFIEFSTDEERNLTLCLAKNNGGKTTLAQSIIWCLYGYTILNEPNEILNKDVEFSMVAGETRKVSVTLEVIHKGQLYIIRREQDFTKTNTQFIVNEPNQTIMTYDSNNVLQDVSDKDINEILPQSLSRFFIFDGERMLHMGTNNNSHKHVLEKDIQTILGLDILEEAVSHLGGWHNRGGVLNSLYKKIDTENDSEIAEVKLKIEEINEIINTFDEQIEETSEIQSNTEIELLKVTGFLEQSKPVQEKQQQRKKLEEEVNSLVERKEKLKKQILRKFSGSFSYLLLQKLFDKTISFVANSTDLEEAAPDVTSATIDYILENKECICGTTFQENDKTYYSLKNNREFYPPESIGTTTKRYLDALRGITKSNEENREELQDIYAEYLEVGSDVHDKEVKLDIISRGIKESSEEEVKKAEEDYQSLKQAKDELSTRLTELKTEKKFQIQNRKDLESKLDELSNKNAQNRKILNYREFTKEILNNLKEYYNIEKDKVRVELQNEVQRVYNKINRGKGKLNITEKFDFELYTESNGQLIKDNSKGQGLSTVAAFAFVCGITKLVREKKLRDELGFTNEPYPLVIDAPYSVMDTDYIEKVSRVLPEHAEQVIVLVKDDNYETAKSIFYGMGVIGKEYTIELQKDDNGKENQFRTTITENKNMVGA